MDSDEMARRKALNQALIDLFQNKSEPKLSAVDILNSTLKGIKTEWPQQLFAPVGNEALLSALKGTFASIKTPDQYQLEDEIAQLRRVLTKEQRQAEVSADSVREKDRIIRELEDKVKVHDVLSRVRPEAHHVIRESTVLREKFTEGVLSQMYVVSIDLRRSTEMMLKAREPKLYADFIGELCGRLMEQVQTLDGIVDKFTGDGVLAYFPDFFTGTPASANVVDLALNSHEIFADTYKKHYGAFTTILVDVGVGVGIDYGECQVVRLGGAVSIVGVPVVYACRFASAPAGKTYINRVGYEQILHEQGSSVAIEEIRIDIKHEGPVLAYELIGCDRLTYSDEPAWKLALITTSSDQTSTGNDDLKEGVDGQ